MSKLSLIIVSVAALVSVGTMGCAAEAVDDAEDSAVGDDDWTSSEDAIKRGTSGVAGNQLSVQEVADTLRAAGFASSVIPKMVCTAKYESRYFDRAWNARNRNGTIDRGLFQINSIHLGRGGLCVNMGLTGDDLFNPETNAECAKKVYDAQGINAWYGYRAHKSECDRYRLPAQ